MNPQFSEREGEREREKEKRVNKVERAQTQINNGLFVKHNQPASYLELGPTIYWKK